MTEEWSQGQRGRSCGGLLSEHRLFLVLVWNFLLDVKAVSHGLSTCLDCTTYGDDYRHCHSSRQRGFNSHDPSLCPGCEGFHLEESNRGKGEPETSCAAQGSGPAPVAHSALLPNTSPHPCTRDGRIVLESQQCLKAMAPRSAEPGSSSAVPPQERQRTPLSLNSLICETVNSGLKKGKKRNVGGRACESCSTPKSSRLGRGSHIFSDVTAGKLPLLK